MAHNLEREIMKKQSLVHGKDAVDESEVEIGRRELFSAKNKLALSGEYERIIGVLEGLIEHDPHGTANYRLEIGHYRRQQGDQASAAWNYDQALKLRAIKHNRIQKKTDDLKSGDVKCQII
jgi:hypothetical protein